jgi:outer membrane protein assembly factor BamB
VGDYLLVADMGGIVTCYEAATGKDLGKGRLAGKFSSSPTAAGGLAYFQNDEGTTFVLEPGPALKVVARNELGAPAEESFRAALTPSAGQVFARSDRALYCIGGRGDNRLPRTGATDKSK